MGNTIDEWWLVVKCGGVILIYWDNESIPNYTSQRLNKSGEIQDGEGASQVHFDYHRAGKGSEEQTSTNGVDLDVSPEMNMLGTFGHHVLFSLYYLAPCAFQIVLYTYIKQIYWHIYI